MLIKSKKGYHLYKKAKKLILNGNMLLSKRPEMILPEKWPTYFSKAKNVYIHDLDNNKYLDMMCIVGNLHTYSQCPSISILFLKWDRNLQKWMKYPNRKLL